MCVEMCVDMFVDMCVDMCIRGFCVVGLRVLVVQPRHEATQNEVRFHVVQECAAIHLKQKYIKQG